MKKPGTSRGAVLAYEQPLGKKLAVFAAGKNLRGLNALALAGGVFEIEKTSRLKRVNRAVIPTFGAKSLGLDLMGLAAEVHDLLVYVLADDIEISFARRRRQRSRAPKTCQPGVVPNVCLFSGGVDSYVGLLTAKRLLGDVEGVFCAHSDQSRMIHIVHRIQEGVLDGAGIRLRSLRVPSIGVRGYAQLRGFLYMVSAAAWMQVLGAHRLIVTECGPTMYQPRFSPLDSITMTTHPVVVNFSRRVVEMLLGRPVEFLLPFEDLTKAEVMAISPDKKGLRETHSCISQRFGRHDGTCYGCVIRRLAGLASGVEDVTYDRNPIRDEDASAGNLLTLLTYCFDMLTGYSEMETHETEMIEAYRKRDLFRRFALDNYAAIHRLVSRGERIRSSVRRAYARLIKKIGTKALEARIADLERGEFVPKM